MDSIERLVVHVEHALDLAEATDTHRLRLALLLLDSAAELMLHRESTFQVQHSEMDRSLVEMHERHSPNSVDPYIVEARARVVSRTEARQIDRVFGKKIDYLVRLGVLDLALGDALGRLHQYRNEAYHQDRIRQPTLSSAVRIYVALVLDLMRTLKPHMVVHRASAHPDLAKYFEDNKLPFPDGFEVQEKIAEAMLNRSHLESADDLSEALVDHCLRRFEDLDHTLEWVTEEFRARMSDSDWDIKATIRFAQIKWTPTMRRYSAADYRAEPVAFTGSDLSRLRSDIASIGVADTSLGAFRRFAQIESELEKGEGPINKLAGELDGQIEHEVDVARGK